ncbi:hypothetical protein AB0L74_10495 [Streptomyces sp. NPDC052020]|uniref:hypothetical protein n=1 Tax=Streptomyces sp. NPDC052020 TaxID=3155677 RepID=UPI0034260D96
MKKLVLAGAGALLALALTGCDDRKCLQSHTDIMPVTQVTAKGQPYIAWFPVETCDKYEEPTP